MDEACIFIHTRGSISAILDIRKGLYIIRTGVNTGLATNFGRRDHKGTGDRYFMEGLQQDRELT